MHRQHTFYFHRENDGSLIEGQNKLTITDHDSHDACHKQSISRKEGRENLSRSENLPWADSESQELNNVLSSRNRKIAWQEHTAVRSKGNHVGGNIRSKDRHHPAERQQEDCKASASGPVPIEDSFEQIPGVPEGLGEAPAIVDSRRSQDTERRRDRNSNWVGDKLGPLRTGPSLTPSRDIRLVGNERRSVSHAAVDSKQDEPSLASFKRLGENRVEVCFRVHHAEDEQTKYSWQDDD